MSGDDRDLYHHRDLFFDDDICSIFSHKPTIDGCTPQDIHSLNPPPVTPVMNFSDYGSFEKAFDVLSSCLPPLDAFSSGDLSMGGGNNANISSAAGGAVTGTPTTPNSSVTWSSTEAAGDEKDQPKPEEEVMQLPAERNEDGGDCSKKLSKPRKKGEKRTREPRFAFVTKSDVDHLEDGYRWRKYGQKAVKNSPYPRSYYRCTTQKCSVKKRVERSFQDPETVITTYEGQHTHHSPATIRGSSHMLAPQPSFHSSYLHYPLMNQLHPMNNNGQQRQQMMNPSMYLQNRPSNYNQLQLANYGLLQDIVPTYVNNSQP